MSDQPTLGLEPPRAVFSPCRVYRYELHRRWGPGERVLFVLLNPSTADEDCDDPTIRRCIGYAKRWGFGALAIANAFAYRSTDPGALYDAPDPVGPENDAAIERLARDATRVVVGWGTHAVHVSPARPADVALIVGQYHRTVWCLGRNGDGSPKHPLYLAAGTPLAPWAP